MEFPDFFMGLAFEVMFVQKPDRLIVISFGGLIGDMTEVIPKEVGVPLLKKPFGSGCVFDIVKA